MKELKKQKLSSSTISKTWAKATLSSFFSTNKRKLSRVLWDSTLKIQDEEQKTNPQMRIENFSRKHKKTWKICSRLHSDSSLSVSREIVRSKTTPNYLNSRYPHTFGNTTWDRWSEPKRIVWWRRAGFHWFLMKMNLPLSSHWNFSTLLLAWMLWR